MVHAEGAAGSSSSSSEFRVKFWKKLWGACVPRKVKICVWRACLDSLPTRLNLRKRKVMIEEVCVVCGGQVESTEHVLRDCTVAKAVWFRGLGLRVDGGHGVCLMNWLANLQFQGSATGFDLCLMLIWLLWKNRNEILWNIAMLPPLEIVLRTEGWMHEFHKWHKSMVRMANWEIQKWMRLVEGWVKCNFDGAWNQRSNRGGYGVVIRNHVDDCLAAAIGPIERAHDAVHAEFFASRKAALLAHTLGTVEGKFQFEGDAALVLAAMKGRGEDTYFFGPILNDLQCLLMAWPNSVVSHVQREKNSASHRLTRMRITSA